MVVACAHCGSPVSVPATSTPVSPATPTPASPATPTRVSPATPTPVSPAPAPDRQVAPATAAWRVPWPKVALVLTALLVAHVGLHLLLTGDARARSSALLARWGGALDAAPAPGPMPGPTHPDYAAWDEAKSRYDAASELKRHERHRSMLALGLSFSFLIQLGITLGLVWRFTARARVAETPRRRGRAART